MILHVHDSLSFAKYQGTNDMDKTAMGMRICHENSQGDGKIKVSCIYSMKKKEEKNAMKRETGRRTRDDESQKNIES